MLEPTYNAYDITLVVVSASSSSPTVSSLGTTSGSTGGGTSVTITGTNFLDTTSDTFDGVAAWYYEIASDSVIVATAPAKASGTGTVDVRVSTTAGTSRAVAADQYT